MEDKFKAFVGGFSLCGQRQSDGKLNASASGLASANIIAEWPEVVEFDGRGYTLENVVKNPNGWEEAQYV